MNRVRNIKIEDYDYPLPEERIALHPLARRDSCKLLVAGGTGKIYHRTFSDLPILIKPDTLIVANETKVIRARMEFVKDTGAHIEIFLLEPAKPHDYVTNFASRKECSWKCLVGNRKRWKEGALTKKIDSLDCTLKAELEGELEEGGYEVKFSWDNPEYSFAEIVEATGNIPIPPYLKRESEDSDTDDYQTVYSKTEGSVAAPTAGLHFTPELIRELKHYGDEFATVTLHVGAGTFQPVKTEEIGDHPMHTEWISVEKSTLMRLINALENGRDILAVGTTSVRTLESLPYLGEQLRGKTLSISAVPTVTQWMPYEERYKNINTVGALKRLVDYMVMNDLEALETTTSIMIAPGFRWRIVDRLITNFHQPKSTLLLLVSSFLGKYAGGEESWREVYREALANDYRFLSYGDACLFSRGEQPVELPLSKSMLLRRIGIEATRPHESENGKGEKNAPGAWNDSCDDVRNYVEALEATKQSVGMPEGRMMLINIGEGAAPLRFTVAYAASLPGAKVKITASPALEKRPIKPLIDALKEMGAQIEFEDDPRWNIRIAGHKLKGGKVKVDSTLTSQYHSALLLASPLWEKPAEIDDNSRLRVSKPYLRMTEEMMAHPEIEPEPDWSAAAFFYENLMISGKGQLEIAALTPPARSLQGDAVACDIFGSFGVNTEFRKDGGATLRYAPPAVSTLPEDHEFEYDFSDCPDLVPAVAVALCIRMVPFRLRGVGSLRYKESDRLGVLFRTLTRLGYGVETDGESLVFNGEFRPMEEFPVEIDSYGDHRIAMGFYPLELKGMVKIENKDVVGKSFPNYYQQFK